jgi:hypothetical protein
MSQQLTKLDLVTPGFRGLNFEQAGSLLPPQFATQAEDCIIDEAGRLAVRQGYSDVTTTDITSNPAIEAIHEYVDNSGSTEIIVAWDGGIANDVADPEGNDISGSVTDTSGRWNFANFNDKCIGFQAGQKPIVYNGTGNFAAISESSGTAPSGGIGTAAFGRVWCVDSDLQTVQYSGLLDETDWNTVGDSGSIDMSNVWTDGTDVVTAIAAFNGALVVFGRRHIVFWVDGQGSALGLDPDQIYVADVITGTGCVSELTVKAVGETDLYFLSDNGVQSLSRVIQERSNPVTNLTGLVRSVLLSDLNEETFANIRAVYDAFRGFYLLSLPGAERTWCIDTRAVGQDGSGVVTTWTLAPTALCATRDNKLYFGGTYGVGLYGGFSDAGTDIRFRYRSPWLDLGEDVGNRTKLLKRIQAILTLGSSTDVLFRWWTNFKDVGRSDTVSVTVSSSAEWGVGEFSIAEFSGSAGLNILKTPARDRGQYYRIGIEASVSGNFAVSQAELAVKIGRLA